MATKKQSAERTEAIEQLRATLKPGDVLTTIVRHVSRSGMMRSISAIKPGKPGELYPVVDISRAVALAIGMPFDRNNGGVKVSGCGMDMTAELVYQIGAAAWRAGFGCIGELCPSNDHSNGDRDYRPHMDDCPQSAEEVGTDIPRERSYRHWHSDGGYALRNNTL